MSTVTIAPPSPTLIQARHFGGAQVPTLSVMHGTVSHDDPGTAKAIAEWWHGPTSPTTSAHYVIDPDAIIQCVPDHREAFHCGYNSNSLGWELCDEETGPASRWDDANSKAIIARAADNVARAHLAYGIPIRALTDAQLLAWDKGGRKAKDGGIVTHAQMSQVFHKSTHVDPTQFDMAGFVKKVRAAAKEIEAAAAGPVPVTPPVALVKPRPVPVSFADFLHYPASVVYREDSFRGVKVAAKRKGTKKAIDINCCGRTKNGVLVALHWPQPLLHGFTWDKTAPARLKALPKTVHIHELTSTDIKHLVAPGGYRIRTLRSVLTLAAGLGVRVELEAKGAAILSKDKTWAEVMSWSAAKSLVARGLLQGKTLVSIPGSAARCKAMKSAGMTVILSTTGAKSDKLKLADYSGNVDYVRGAVSWVA